VVAACAGLVVYLTGEPAEELIEDVGGIAHSVVEQHEEAALIAAVLLGGVGLLSLAGLFVYRRRSIPPRFAAVAFIVALVPAAAMVYTANLGGQIRHSEIRSKAVSMQAVDEAAPSARGEEAEPAGGEHR
jgi:hypothetical protein